MLFDLIRFILSTIFATFRLLSLTFVLLVSGMHGIIFNRSEVVGVTMHTLPLSVDRDKVSYLDDLERRSSDATFGLPDNYMAPPFREDDGYYERQPDSDDFDDNGNDWGDGQEGGK